MVPPEGTCAQPYRHGQYYLGGNDPPRPPCCLSGGTHPPGPPLGGMPSPQTPLARVWQDRSMTERETPSVDGLVIGILGGTGDQGRGPGGQRGDRRGPL